MPATAAALTTTLLPGVHRFAVLLAASLVGAISPTGGLAVLVAAIPVAAHAEKSDREKPITWSGGRLNGRRSEGGADVVELEGKVLINQGTRVIQADRAIIRQLPDGSLRATAFGNPVVYKEKREAADDFVEAFAQRAEYDGQKRTLELFDRALLRREKDEIRASYITYHTETEVYRAEGQGGPDGKGGTTSEGLVRGIFQPKNKEPRDGKAEPTTPPPTAPAGSRPQ